MQNQEDINLAAVRFHLARETAVERQATQLALSVTRQAEELITQLRSAVVEPQSPVIVSHPLPPGHQEALNAPLKVMDLLLRDVTRKP